MTSPPPDHPAIGIDLGTTYSLVAVMEGGSPRIVVNGIGQRLTPSAVSVDEHGHVLVGEAARARSITQPHTAAVGFKRDMGRDVTYTVEGLVDGLTPLQASAMVLRQLKEDAEAALGRSITDAVITVPAYFGEHQRKATKDAAFLAGLRVERVINEPTAAALAYGLHHTQLTQRVAVLDLGGGTFDVTIVEMLEGVIEVQSTAGDPRLGGDDFRDLIAEWLKQSIEETYATGTGLTAARGALARIRQAAEQAKVALTQQEKVTLSLAALIDHSRPIELALTRERAETMWQPLLERIKQVIHRALRDAKVGVETVDEVLMVGGATRMPCVVQLAAQTFGRLPQRTLPPDEAVALGAAVQAALKAQDAAVEDLVVTDIAPFSMGIATSTEMGGHRVSGLFAPVLERGTVIPASRVKRFSTVTDYQRVIKLDVFQGERSMCRDNVLLGSLSIEGLPAAPAGEQAVDVRFTYDLNGLLEVEATIVGADRREVLLIEGAPGRLSKAELEHAKIAMQGLKFHPRQALPNATALERADELFGELTGVEREQLGAGLAAFRTALESQRPERIARQRDALNALVRLLKKRR